ncbi:MAG: polysaccharide deacetylase family protein [Clostridia bacterium]
MNFSIILVIIIICILYITIKSSKVSAIELSCNSIISDEFKSKISNLTNGKEKIAYLTFDDGPNILVTPKILDILKEEDIKATFFVIGKYVEEHPEIVKRAYEEGHYIANHGYDHNNATLYKSKESFINEIKKTEIAIGKAIGIDNYCSYVFRFPNGYMSKPNKAKKQEAAKLLSKMNYSYIDWNCLNNDSIKKYTKEQLLNNLKKSSKNKNTLVVLMHDTKDVSDSSTVLKDSIAYLKSKGYKFENFYDLLENKMISF